MIFNNEIEMMIKDFKNDIMTNKIAECVVIIENTHKIQYKNYLAL